jgi:exonuclease III
MLLGLFGQTHLDSAEADLRIVVHGDYAIGTSRHNLQTPMPHQQLLRQSTRSVMITIDRSQWTDLIQRWVPQQTNDASSRDLCIAC